MNESAELQQQVISRRGLTFWLFVIVGIPLTTFVTFRGIQLILAGGLSWLTVFSMLIFPIVMFWFIGTAFEKVSIDLSGVTVEQGRRNGKKFMSWASLCEIGMTPNFFGSTVIDFRPCSKEPVLQINTFFYRNHNEMAMAVIEAATVANPDISFDILLGNDYGLPPYGIFTESQD